MFIYQKRAFFNEKALFYLINMLIMNTYKKNIWIIDNYSSNNNENKSVKNKKSPR